MSTLPPPIVRVSAYISGGLRQAFITVQTTGHRKYMVYFADKKSTTGFGFVSCYCIVVDDVKIGLHGNAPPSRKQRPLIKAALTLFQPTQCRIFPITSQVHVTSKSTKMP